MNFEKDLESIQCQFLCCRPIKKFDWKSILNDITWDQQGTLAQQTICIDLLTRHNINTSYQIAFLRHIIETLESHNIEVHNTIYEKYVALKNSKPEAYSFKHYKLPEEDVIVTLKESQSMIAQGTTGLYTWQAAGALAEWALANRERFQGKKILELGSGTGLAAFIISLVCKPEQMVLTDGNGLVLKLLKENFEINFKDKEVDGRICVEYLDWNEIESFDIKLLPDLIIASDVIYDSSLFEPLCRTIDYIFDRNSNCSLILACTLRNEDTLNEFLKLIDLKNYKRTEMASVIPKKIYWDDSVPIKIFCICKLD